MIYCPQCAPSKHVPEPIRPKPKTAVYFYKFYPQSDKPVICALCKICAYQIVNTDYEEITESEYRMEKALE